MKTFTITEAFSYFQEFNKEKRATLSVVSPSIDDAGKEWLYRAFLFYPNSKGTYDDVDSCGSDLALCIVSCVDAAILSETKELVDSIV